jgi:hypothetical protein
MVWTYDVLLLAHIVTVVFMSAPLYNLIVVGERVRFGKAPVAVDKYFENIVRGNSTRCYVFQATALITGVGLVALHPGFSLATIITNWALLGKALLLLTLMGLLTVVHFKIQPSIDHLISKVEGDVISPEIAKDLVPLRTLRKRLAATCLFLVLTIIILAMQIDAPFPAYVTLPLLALAALFAWRVYKTPVPYGWV